MKPSKIEDFIEANKLSGVVFGEILTPEGKEVLTANDIDRSDRTMYKLDSGDRFLILHKDMPIDFAPVWGSLSAKMRARNEQP